jgi:hypothetical protein
VDSPLQEKNMPVEMIELEEVTMVETTDESLEVAGGGFGQSITCVEFMGAELAC